MGVEISFDKRYRDKLGGVRTLLVKPSTDASKN